MMFEILLEEDTCFGDITSELTIPDDLRSQAKVIAKEKCVVAGMKYLSEKVAKFDLRIDVLKGDGENAEEGDIVALIEGNARRLLLIERTFLNILGRMSGIATATRRIVSKVHRINPKIRIAATRKTLLGYLDKLAVIIGGGDPHRWGLADLVLIKDNHIALVGLEEAIERAKKASFVRKVEVEVKNVEEAIRAANLDVDVIMLDNFELKKVLRVITLLKDKGLRDKVLVEASGGINEDNVEEYAECGVDIISMGFLTHSSKSIDFSMKNLAKH